MKKIALVTILLISMIGTIAGQTRQPAWFTKMKQVKLLTSTYSSVVELFGEPKNTESIIRTFKTNDGELSITLSTGKCGTPYKKGYDVEADVVERATYYIKQESRVKAKKLGIKVSKFRKIEVFDLPGTYTYENGDGLVFGTDKNGLVDYIDFFPTSVFDNLYCK